MGCGRVQEKQGYVFETETDTEVIAKLAKYVYDTQTEDGENNSFEAVVKAVVKELQGAYALIFKSSLFPHEMIATRRGSPLLLGIRAKDAAAVEDKLEVTFSPAPVRKGIQRAQGSMTERVCVCVCATRAHRLHASRCIKGVGTLSLSFCAT
jgi:glutamine---fructose-6-phosphate transaminase (isomerizing)